MRKLFRLVAPVLAAAAIALGSGSTALAAASPTSVSLDANWSFQDGSTEYRFDVTGRAHFLDNKVGSSVTVNEITRTTVYESDQYVGETQSVQMFRGVFAADGTVTMQSVINTRSSAGDETCTYRLVLRLVDYEATVFHETSTCGG